MQVQCVQTEKSDKYTVYYDHHHNQHCLYYFKSLPKQIDNIGTSSNKSAKQPIIKFDIVWEDQMQMSWEIKMMKEFSQ